MDSIIKSVLRSNCTTRNSASLGSSLSGSTGSGQMLSPPSNFGHQLIRSNSHQSILESHANSATNALIYIGVVLLLYILAMAFIIMRYVVLKSQSKSEQSSPPYYFGGSAKIRGTTTTTATTTLGGASVTGFAIGGGLSCIEGDGDDTPPEIKFIETEL